jgi:G:T/U-mismatch repair DNA glycosylase
MATVSKIQKEQHPYGEFIPSNPRAMIIGSFPIGKFSDPKRRSEIKSHEVDFFFGGEKNLLWKLLGEVFNLSVKTKEDVQSLLETQGLAVGDVIRSCFRKRGGASDTDLYNIEWNLDLLKIIRKYGIKKLYFTSKKVEVWFLLLFPDALDLERITLISPSGQSVRGLYKRPGFEAWVKKNPLEKKYLFILEDYKKKFQNL